MEQLLETFCLVDGEVLNVPYHEARVVRSVGNDFPIGKMVETVRNQAAVENAMQGRWRASVTYTAEGVERVRLVQYVKPSISALRMISIEENFYSKKWADRSRLNGYKEALPQGVEPIFVLEGKVTDTTFSNVVVERDGTLYIPDMPLLAGTKRHRLLDTGVVRSISLRVDDLRLYERIHLVNAMLDPGELVLSIDAVG